MRAKNRGRTDLKAKFEGGMIGSALGDAIGELAFRYPDLDSLHSMLDQVSSLRYTDDTAMAIGIAESLTVVGELDPRHLGETFRRNFKREPWRGYAGGPPSIFAMVEQEGISYTEAAGRLFGGKGSFGNGAAMRIVALGLRFYAADDLCEQARKSASVTHAHPVGMDGAAIQAGAVAEAVRLDPAADFSHEPFVRQLKEMARSAEIHEKLCGVEELLTSNASPAAAARRIGQSVAVHESMPFALYAFLRSPGSYRDCLFCAIMHGGDRDTLGAMAGAISGAYLGSGAIPSEWQEKLENGGYIKTLAADLAGMTEGNE